MQNFGVCLLLLQFFCSVYMMGVIWFVQLVHYPMMADYERSRYVTIQHAHQARTSRVVLVPMLLSLLCGILLLIWPPDRLGLPWAVANIVLTFIWCCSTAFWQVPLHSRLSELGYEASTHHQLVQGNWLRTVAWTVQAVLNAVMLWFAGLGRN